MNYSIYFLILFVSFCFGDLNRPTSGKLLSYIHVVFDWDQEPMAHSYQLELSKNTFFNDNSLILKEVRTTYVEQNYIDWDMTSYTSKVVGKFESSTNKGVFYEVTKTGKKYNCNCPGFRMAKSGKCKHLKSILQ